MSKKGVPSREILAYTAGLVDGEGYIGITKNGKHKSGAVRYTMKVIVGSTDKPMVDFLEDNFGGSVSVKTVIGNRQPAWIWGVTANKAADFLKQIVEFLRIKKPQAELAIAFQGEGRPMRKPTESERNKIKGIAFDLRKMNAVGRRAINMKRGSINDKKEYAQTRRVR